MRMHQWIKNLIIFAGLIFSEKLTEPALVLKSVIAFFLFSLIASCQYVINDYLDRNQDALHPEKKSRPIASKKIDPAIALFITAILLPVSLVLAYILEPMFFALCLFYFVFNLTYSKYLKHLVILDVMSISIGFVIRAISGSVVIHVSFSSWLLLCTFMLSLYWGFGKRRGEILLMESGAKSHRKILSEYSIEFLNHMMGIVATMTLLSYVMYATSPVTIQKLGTDKLIFTIPLVTYAIFRSFYISFIKNVGHNSTMAILKDKSIIIAGIIWFFMIVTIIYTNSYFHIPNLE